MALIIDILRASREIFYFSMTLHKLPLSDRLTLADTLTYIGGVVKDIFDKLTAGDFPEGNCAQLALLGQELYHHLHPVLGIHHARSLTEKLDQTSRMTGLHREISLGIIDVRELVLLDEAANHFSGTAQLLNA
ncbi:MAG: hypothetical protein JNM78_17380 [Cyclobacteriaceae bacterium]|nr:hypothetical protein [Cyclobacteriaceae bacterium]